MPEATPDGGAPQSIHDRLTAILDAEEATQTPEAKPEAVKQEKQTDEAVTQESETVEAQAETEEQLTETEAEADAESTEETQEPPKTLKELSERLGMDYDQLLESIAADTKIDGEEGRVPLSKLLKSYQLEGHLNRKSMELAEAKKAFEQEAQTRKQQFDEGLEQLRQSLTLGNQLLQGEYAQIDWASLEKSDPVQYLSLRTKFEDRQRQLLQGFQFLQQEDAKRSETSQKEFAKYIEEEGKKLVNAVPEWADSKTKAKETQGIKEYLKSQGFTDTDVSQVYDHRLVLVARDAMRYRELKSKQPVVTKKVNEAPKLAKPGAQKSSADNEKAVYLEQRKQLKKTGKIPRGLLERFV